MLSTAEGGMRIVDRLNFSRLSFTSVKGVIMIFEAVYDGLHATLLTWQRKAREMDGGQGLVEYALILVLVAVVVIVVLSLMGPAIGNVFSNVLCGVMDAQNASCS